VCLRRTSCVQWSQGEPDNIYAVRDIRRQRPAKIFGYTRATVQAGKTFCQRWSLKCNWRQFCNALQWGSFAIFWRAKNTKYIWGQLRTVHGQPYYSQPTPNLQCSQIIEGFWKFWNRNGDIPSHFGMPYKATNESESADFAHFDSKIGCYGNVPRSIDRQPTAPLCHGRISVAVVVVVAEIGKWNLNTKRTCSVLIAPCVQTVRSIGASTDFGVPNSWKQFSVLLNIFLHHCPSLHPKNGGHRHTLEIEGNWKEVKVSFPATHVYRTGLHICKSGAMIRAESSVLIGFVLVFLARAACTTSGLYMFCLR